jgi:hypothetical protein
MNRDGLRRGLAWGLVATLVLPVLLAVVLGLGALLGQLGDTAGAMACGRIGIVVGVAWLTAIVGTVAVTAASVLDGEPRPRAPGPPRGRRRSRRVDRLVAERLAAERDARERPS